VTEASSESSQSSSSSSSEGEEDSHSPNSPLDGNISRDSPSSPRPKFKKPRVTLSLRQKRGAYRRAGQVFRQFWGSFFLATLCLMVSAVAKIGLPNYQGTIIDAVFERDTDQFRSDVVALTVCSLILLVFGLIRDASVALLGRRIAAHVRSELFAVMVRQDVALFDYRAMSGQLTATLTNDVNAMVAPWQAVITVLLNQSIVIVGGMLMCWLTSWRLTAISLSTLLPMTYLASMYTMWSTRLNREIWSGISDANAVATEALGNIRTVKAFAMEEAEIRRFRRATTNTRRKGLLDVFGTSIVSAIYQNLNLIGTVLVLGFGGWEALHHPETLSPGELVKYVLYWTMVTEAARQVNGQLNNFSRGHAALLRVFTFLNQLENRLVHVSPTMHLETTELSSVAGPEEALKVELRDVWFRYPSSRNRYHLRHVNMVFNANKITVVTGRSGAGKSSVFKLILRLYDCDSGQLLINNLDTVRIKRDQLRRAIGIVAVEDLPLFGSTVLSNLVYGLGPDEYTQDDVEQAAKDAHAHDFIMRLQYGYQSRIGEGGAQLSLGEKARVSIARAFLHKPRLLLLDEPIANLDRESQSLVLDSIQRLASSRQVTIVLITHHITRLVTEMSDHIYVLDRGTVVETGSFRELSSDKQTLFWRLFGHAISFAGSALNDRVLTARSSGFPSLEDIEEEQEHSEDEDGSSIDGSFAGQTTRQRRGLEENWSQQ